MRQRHRRGAGWAGVLLALAAFLVSGCGGQPPTQPHTTHVEVSKKQYGDPAALARDAAVIVRGVLAPDPEPVVDDGGSAGRHGIPSLLYTVQVSAQAHGSEVGSEITVLWIDTDRITVEGVTALQPGQEYVLFLDRIERSERGGLQEHGTLYTPVGLNSGIFRVESGQAVPTEQQQRDGGLVGDLLRTVGVQELLELVPGKT